jgi:phosphopentomutase
MDGLDTKTSKIFSNYIKTLEILRRTIKKSDLQIKNSENIYGEVYYADSKYSIFTQLVDMISYMLHCRDIKKFGENYSEFKGKIIEMTEKIKPDLINLNYYQTKKKAC